LQTEPASVDHNAVRKCVPHFSQKFHILHWTWYSPRYHIIRYAACTSISWICVLFLQIDCCIKLSGMPDLTLSFMNPRLFDDVSFHPCVRFKRWEVSFLSHVVIYLNCI